MNQQIAPDWEKEEKTSRSYALEILIVVMVLLLLLVYFWTGIFVQIPAGHRGVLFRPLNGGTVTDKSFGEGIALIWPWNTMNLYDVRVLAGQDTIAALTEDGLSVSAEISYRYQPQSNSLGIIHKSIGMDYKAKIIVPHMTAATRDVVSRYRVDALFTTGRQDMQEAMLKQVRQQVDSVYPITILDLVVRNIVIDKTVEKAIADKLVKEQEMLGYDFILKKEEKEETRKRIEARGIKLFRDSSGIDFLRWKGIEATKELATSPNAKVVVIGSGRDGLPIILGGNGGDWGSGTGD